MAVTLGKIQIAGAWYLFSGCLHISRMQIHGHRGANGRGSLSKSDYQQPFIPVWFSQQIRQIMKHGKGLPRTDRDMFALLLIDHQIAALFIIFSFRNSDQI